MTKFSPLQILKREATTGAKRTLLFLSINTLPSGPISNSILDFLSKLNSIILNIIPLPKVGEALS